jgi:SynChlorMet cassette radical SAM/SPASM protein ScmF
MGSTIMPALNTLYFYLTEGCNLACRHCWIVPHFDATGQHSPSLPVELFETAIREAKPLGLSSVKLTGGEPLIHPHFRRLLEIVRREELRLIIETNGLLVTPEIAAEIAKSPNRFVSVSIDGTDAATHEWVRGVPGAFEAARQAVINLVAAGTRPQVIFTVMRKECRPGGCHGANGGRTGRKFAQVQRGAAHRTRREVCMKIRRPWTLPTSSRWGGMWNRIWRLKPS